MAKNKNGTEVCEPGVPGRAGVVQKKDIDPVSGAGR
jgi:hypothetical protein